MREITTYIADDGTEFDNEDECQQYEYEQHLESYNFTLADITGNIVKDPEKAWYCYIPDGVADPDTLADEVLEYEGQIMPRGWGSFYWCDDSTEWVEISTKLDELQAEIDRLKSIERALVKANQEG